MAATRDNEVGRCKCPVCASTRARLRVSAKQLAYVVCDACNAQVFARSDRSDAALRALHLPDAAPAPVEPASIPEPVRTEAPAPKPAPGRTDAPKPPAAAPQPFKWGFNL